MKEAPTTVTDAEILTTVRANWSSDVDQVSHLAVGFGAYHWVAATANASELFVTLDSPRPGLEDAYSAAATLYGAGLDFVVPSLRSEAGTFTVPVNGAYLSATRWIDGTRPESSADARTLIDSLHAASPPERIPRWEPLVGADLADQLAESTADPWESGPYGERARTAVRRHLIDIDRWTRRYHHLVAAEADRTWVPTHGEPHVRNQLITSDGLRLVDWETLKLAPPARDLCHLGEPSELFDLEWRLDEIHQYAAWFKAEHLGTDSDETAITGLEDELTRPAVVA